MLYDSLVKVKELIAEIERRGWELDRIRGSHHVFTHPNARRSVVVPVHGKEIPSFFAKSILKQADAALGGE